MTPTTIQQGPAVEHKECLGLAVKKIFRTACGAELKTLKSTPDTDGSVIVGMISLSGDLNWSIFIGLSSETASSLISKFFGFEIPFDSDDMCDAAGELASILAGEIKTQLSRRGIKVNLSLPSAIRAKNVYIPRQNESDTFRLSLGTSGGNLWAGITTRSIGIVKTLASKTVKPPFEQINGDNGESEETFVKQAAKLAS